MIGFPSSLTSLTSLELEACLADGDTSSSESLDVLPVGAFLREVEMGDTGSVNVTDGGEAPGTTTETLGGDFDLISAGIVSAEFGIGTASEGGGTITTGVGDGGFVRRSASRASLSFVTHSSISFDVWA